MGGLVGCYLRPGTPPFVFFWHKWALPSGRWPRILLVPGFFFFCNLDFQHVTSNLIVLTRLTQHLIQIRLVPTLMDDAHALETPTV